MFITELDREEQEGELARKESQALQIERFGEPTRGPLRRFGLLFRRSAGTVTVIDNVRGDERTFAIGEYSQIYDWQQCQLGKTRMKIYVASSWRNLLQPAVVTMLRRSGHEVYDFRNPAPGNTGFNWREIDANWEQWTPRQYRAALNHPIAKEGFRHDMHALRQCDACVLVLPSGRSASWEFGYAIGQGKKGAVVMFDKCEPELMYLGNPILANVNELLDWASFQDRTDGDRLSEAITTMGL